MTTPLPAIVRKALAIDAWPDDPQRRAIYSRGLRGDPRLALLRWAYASAARAAGGPPTVAQWAEVAGLAASSLRGARAASEELAALPLAGRTYARKPAGELTAESARVRESRDRRRKGEAPRKAGRPAKPPAGKAV